VFLFLLTYPELNTERLSSLLSLSRQR